MTDLNFKLLRWQTTVMQSKARFKVIVAGRRCGKTRFSAVDLIVKALECTATDATVLYVAPTYGMAKTLMWDLLLTLAQPVTAKSNINDGELTLVNGVKIRIRGSDNPDSLRGMKLYHVVMDETKDFKANVWPLIISPSLSDMKGTALVIGTPEPGESEFRDMYEMGLSGEDDEWQSWHFTTMDNELIDPKEIASAKRRLSTQAFEQEFMASFETMGENIFKESWLLYNDKPPAGGTTFIAVDPAGFEGVANPNEKRHLDNTAIAVVTVSDEGKWWVQKIEYGRWDVREAAVRILMAIRTHRPMVVGVERGALAKALMPYLSDLMRKNGVYVHIEHIAISGSKANRITYNLQGLFEHGRIVLNSREDWSQFRKEYVAFPSRKTHDDLIDSLSLVANLVNTSYMKDDGGGSEWEPLDEISGL